MSVQLRARRLTRVCQGAAAVVLLVFGLLALLLPRGSSGGVRFGVVDQVLFFGVGLGLALGLLALTRPRVRADATGIWVRNVLAERYFAWAVVATIRLPVGASWAQLELHDDQSVALLAVQANDTDASGAVEQLRSLQQQARTT